MSALLNPVNRPGGGTKWGLAAYAATLFSLVTIGVAIDIRTERISYIDDREFPGNDIHPPGPNGYQGATYGDAFNTVQTCIFILGGSLTDGFLLYRCYIIYAMNHWAIAFPSLMYLASTATGITFVIELSRPNSFFTRSFTIYDLEIAYCTISFSLNFLLTLMIIIRLVRHSMMIRNALGPSTEASGTYETIIVILVESFALYAINYILYLGLVYSVNEASDIFQPILGQVQVINPLLIVLRVAKRTAVTADSIVSDNVGSIRFNSQGNSEGSDEARANGDSVGSVDANEEVPTDLGVGAENVIEEVPR